MPAKTLLGLLLCIIVLLTIGTVFSQQKASKYKNIKVLHDVLESEIPKLMMNYTRYLGVKCTFCHDINDYSNEEMRTYKVSRTMIQMLQDINKKYLSKVREQEVTCNVCHRGNHVPEEKP